VLASLAVPASHAGASTQSTSSTPTAKSSTKAKKSTTRKRVSSRARRAAARRAQAARTLREASTPKYRVDEVTGALVPDLRADAAIIYDVKTGEVLWEQNAQDQRSIASITKVMTAVVFLEGNPDLTQDVVIVRDDTRGASTTFLRVNERVKFDDLLHLTLIPSDNAAARALARTYPGGMSAFVDRMNQKALDLGLQNTHYADPSGLSSDNVSSAYDMARLITYAASNDKIASVMRTAEYTFGTNRRNRVTVRNTNQLVRQGDVDVLGGKTGFIRKAGYCLATLLRLPEGGPEIAVVVLGARSNVGRFWETRHLFNWFAQNTRSLFSTSIPQEE
jgi:D-alanyl-D-alanine endopeptidase (penicillin-binding protein 7)